MNITRRPDLEAFLLDEMRDTFSRDERTEDEIHVSDLLSPRKAYWSRVRPKPLTDDEIGYFVAGRAHEDAVGRISGVEAAAPRTIEGIRLRPDFYTSIPLEFKTRRRKLAADPTEAVHRYDGYIDQCRAYAALLERPAAWLWVLGLVSEQADRSTKPEFQVWHLDFTPVELEETRRQLHLRRDLLREAWAQRDHEGLPLCPAWQCGKRSAILVEPPLCETCGKSFVAEWGANKHLASRTGDGHTMRHAVYRYEYVPRCKWYQAECQPWLVDASRGISGVAPIVAEPESVAHLEPAALPF